MQAHDVSQIVTHTVDMMNAAAVRQFSLPPNTYIGAGAIARTGEAVARLVLGVTASNISVLHKLPPAPVVVDERADAPADFQSVMKSLLKRSGRS